MREKGREDMREGGGSERREREAGVRGERGKERGRRE